jgi:hypothetical protein
MKYLFLTLIVIACSSKKHEAESSSDDRKLALTYLVQEQRLALTEEAGESHWLAPHECDSSLWNGEALAAGVDAIDLSIAEYSPGEIHRRPPPSCWDGSDQGSKSTVSNDMILGWMAGMWRTRDLAALQRLADYGEEHEWVMGKPFPEMASRVVLKPNQIGLLGRMIYALSNGRDDRSYRKWFKLYTAVSEDYEKHIQALSIMLQGEVDEFLRLNSLDATRADPDGQPLALLDVNQGMLERLQALASSDPQDALFACVLGVYSGDMSRALDLLFSDAYLAPSYARGDEVYKNVHWLFAADCALRRLD